jgi:multidrug efflux pump subunit AcrB
MADSERAPLLGDAHHEEAEGGNRVTRSAKKVARWVSRHATLVFAAILVVAMGVVLIVFFGGNVCSFFWKFKNVKKC